MVARSAEMETPVIFVAMNYRCVRINFRFIQLTSTVLYLRLNGTFTALPSRLPLFSLNSRIRIPRRKGGESSWCGQLGTTRP